MAYCDLDDVKRLLRVLSVSGNTQYKVRFSDSYTVPKAYSTNTGTGILKGVGVALDTYAGSELWHITFTSTTAFTLYRGDGTDTSDGSGTTSSSFTSTSGIITITAAQWSGTFVSGDQYKFRTDSNISNDDGDEFIVDADAIVDGMLSEFLDEDYIPYIATNDSIKRASIYYSASIIFTSVFSNLNTDQVPTLVRRWYNQGRSFARLFLESIEAKKIFKYSRYGRFVSHEPLIENIGIKEVAGIEGLKGEVDVVNEGYDNDYNEEESL